MAYLGGATRSVKRFRPPRSLFSFAHPRIAPRSVFGSGLGDVTSTLTTAEGIATNPVGSAVNFLTQGLTKVFGTGDVSAFQDMLVQNTARLAAGGNVSALAALAGLSGRYGAVAVPDKAGWLDELVGMRPDQGASIRSWGTGDPTRATLVGPIQRYGSQDLAWSAFQQLVSSTGQIVPPPNQFQTRTGNIGNLQNPTQLAVTWPAGAGNASAGTTSTLYGGIPGLPTVPAQPGVVGTGGGLARMTGGMSPLLLAGLAVGAVLVLKKRR